jgi:hypothetical protein
MDWNKHSFAVSVRNGSARKVRGKFQGHYWTKKTE